MKSPEDLRQRLRRQWARNDTRVERLLDGPWPLLLPIGAPSTEVLRSTPQAVRQHIEAWRQVAVGEVTWQERSFRGAADSVTLPTGWALRSPSEWIAAMDDASIRQQYALLGRLAAAAHPGLRPALLRHIDLLTRTIESDAALACAIAPSLQRGMAHGLPLRAVPAGGADTKFWERNRTLLTHLLEALQPGEVRGAGLEAFLGAAPGTEHWLQLIDLDGGLLPWRQMRVRDHELRERAPPGHALLIVENLQSSHQLALRDALPGTVAVLGAGMNLAWMDAPWLAGRRVAYWGDLDTWGLDMLARARGHVPQLQALLMDEALFDAHAAAHAVPEPLPAGEASPAGLLAAEAALYGRLCNAPRGRLEQEFLPLATVHAAVRQWVSAAS